MDDSATAAAGDARREGSLSGVDQQAPPRIGGEKARLARWHHLSMVAMCLPMLVVVGALVATGAAGGGAVLFALVCVAMMAAMMMLMRDRGSR